jgi:hypothetical protein
MFLSPANQVLQSCTCSDIRLSYFSITVFSVYYAAVQKRRKTDEIVNYLLPSFPPSIIQDEQNSGQHKNHYPLAKPNQYHTIANKIKR